MTNAAIAYKSGTRSNGKKPMPAYQTIQSSIRERIEAGSLRPGEAVASERELARMHGVSLMTARHALATLEREGMVERRQGVGTFVASRNHFKPFLGFSEQLAARGLPTSSKTLVSKLVSDEPEIASRLNLPLSSPLVKVERLHEGGNEPFSLEASYCSADRFAGLLTASLSRSSLFVILKRDYNLRMAHVDEEIDAIATDSRMAQIFGIPNGSPMLRIRQVVFSAAGRPEIYVFSMIRADRHTILVRRFC